MTTKDFIKRRLIRLHPMVVLGAVLGVIAFWVYKGVRSGMVRRSPYPW